MAKIAFEEKQNIEYKESWRVEYLKWICGFANAQGGRIYIGVDDDHEVVGIPDSSNHGDAATRKYARSSRKPGIPCRRWRKAVAVYW